MAMLIIAMVAGGVLTAFVFSRGLSMRAGLGMAATNLVEEVTSQLREPSFRNLPAGVYVDDFMLPKARPPGAVTLSAPNPLNLPDDPPNYFRKRYQTNAGRTPAATWADHADGRLVVVEDLVDIDEDGLAGFHFNGSPDGRVDLKRIRVKVKYTWPH